MKKFTFFSLLVCCLAMFATTARAQVNGMVDLFGKYQFTATIDLTDAGKANAADLFKSECEVVITKDDSGVGYAGIIKGLMGSDAVQSISTFDGDNNCFIVNNPNPNYQLWDTNIGVTDTSLDNIQMYSMKYKYNPDTKEITIDPFQIGKIDYRELTIDVYANVTNVKMTLIEAEEIEVPSIAGTWDYAPYEDKWGLYVRNDSTFAYNFTLELAATDDTNKAYDATITYGDFEPFTLPATFDGMTLNIPYDSVYLVDEENDAKYFFAIGSSATKKDGTITFQYESATSLAQTGYIYIRQDSVWVETESTDETTGETIVTGKWGRPIVQQLRAGNAKLRNEAVEGFSWAGKYAVSSSVRVTDATYGEWPTEFELVVQEYEGKYYIREFLGKDVYNMNQSCCLIVPADDNKSATISLAQYYGGLFLERLEDGTYLQLFDTQSDSGTAIPIVLTLNEDGTITISDFQIYNTSFSSEEKTRVARYSELKAEKVVEKFEWPGEYTLTADVEVHDNTREWASEFVAKIEYNEGWDLYLLTEFFNYNNVTSLCYGANSITISEDTKSATYEGVGGYIGGKNPLFYNIFDKNGSTTALNFTVNEDGTVSMDDFVLYVTDYSGDGAAVKGATYTNVVLTRGNSTGINTVVEGNNTVVKGIFDLSGRKLDEITAPGIYIVDGVKVVK